METKQVFAGMEKFFSAAAACGCHTRAITILQGDDDDMFSVCVKDLTNPGEDWRRWIGRGNDTLLKLTATLLCKASPRNPNVTLTVPFKCPHKQLKRKP